MARITVEDCLEKVENQYDLVLLAKERTSQLNSGSEMLVEVAICACLFAPSVVYLFMLFCVVHRAVVLLVHAVFCVFFVCSFIMCFFLITLFLIVL